MTIRAALEIARDDALKGAAKGQPNAQRRLIAIRGALGALEKSETTGRRHDPTEDEAVRVVKSEVETREKSALIYEEVGEPARAADERLEADTLRAFLPREATAAELREAIASIVADQGLEGQGKRAIGAVMKELKASFSNFDSRAASQIIMGMV